MRFKLPPTAALVTAFLVSAPLAAQDLKVEKYTLDNGLQVILHEDHSLPVATINLWYYVGSKDEVAGRSGFAHLFEHLMFMGTTRVPGSGFDDMMERGGGSNNASTSRDRTNYFSMGPSSLLPTLLWLDADRMEAFGKAMTQAKLDKQREVVRNERRQVVEMRPYGKADEALGKILYPASHPYHTSVIGSHTDLEAASLQDVKDFFAQYYVPNNASLVVAGDFDPKVIKPLIAKWYGTIPRGAEVPRKRVARARLDEVRRVTRHDRVQFPRLSLIYLSPPFFKNGDAEMDIASSILTTGKTSRLYKRLVYEDKLAVSVSSYQWSSLHDSQFHIIALARPGVPLAKIEKAIDEEVDRFVAEGPTEEELERTKATLEYGAVSQLESLQGRADALNRYNFYLGNPNGFEFDLERYRSATAQAVKEWSAMVLTKNARVIETVLPEQSAAANPRDEKPELGTAKGFSPQAPELFELSNGIRVHHWHRKELPLVSLVTYLAGGSADEPAAKAGATSLLADMLDEGTRKLTALQFSDAISNLGASFSAAADRHCVRVQLDALASRFESGLALLADAVREPRLAAADWERVKTLHLRGLEQIPDNPSQLARVLTTQVFFGKDHPYGHAIDGSIASVRGLELADVRAVHARIAHPKTTQVFVAGAIAKDQLRAALEKTLGTWQAAGSPPVATVPAAAPRKPMRVYIVDKPKAVQTVIRFMMPGPRLGHPERVTYEAVNTVLGVTFTSRLNANLREKHGFTYGAGSGFTQWPTTGALVASSSVQAEHTGRALEEFLKELKGIGSGNITDEEAEKAKSTNRQAIVELMASLSSLLRVATALEHGGVPFGGLAKQLTSIEALDKAKMNGLAGEVVPLDHACLVLVGNKKLILEQIARLGLPKPAEIDLQGQPVPGR